MTVDVPVTWDDSTIATLVMLKRTKGIVMANRNENIPSSVLVGLSTALYGGRINNVAVTVADVGNESMFVVQLVVGVVKTKRTDMASRNENSIAELIDMRFSFSVYPFLGRTPYHGYEVSPLGYVTEVTMKIQHGGN